MHPVWFGETSGQPEPTSRLLASKAKHPPPSKDPTAPVITLQVMQVYRRLTVRESSANNIKEPSSADLCSLAAKCVTELCKNNTSNQMAIVDAGAIQPLVSMLGNASPELQLPATGVIECLLQSKDLQERSITSGSCTPVVLVDCLRACRLPSGGPVKHRRRALNERRLSSTI